MRPIPTRRRGAALAAAALALSAVAAPLLTATPAAARPVTLEDLLQREGIGEAAFDPTGRRLVVERRGPYASGARFDLESFNDIVRTTLWTAPADGSGPLVPLFAPETGVGYKLGPFSPDGARLAVFRLKDDQWRLGVVRMADSHVDWFEVTPEWPFFGRSLQWRSPTELLFFTTPDGDLPRPMRFRNEAPRKLPARWAASRDGAGAHTVFGSGRYLDSRPHAPPRQFLRLDLATGRSEVLARGDFTDLELSPDGRWAALLEAAEDIRLKADTPLQGAYGLATRRQRLRLLDLRRRRLASPAPELDVLSFLAWSPEGKDLLIYGRRDGQTWPAGRLLRLDARTGLFRPAAPGITPHLDYRPELVRAGWLEGDPVLYGRRSDAPGVEASWFRATRNGPIAATGLAVRANRGIPNRFDRIPELEQAAAGPSEPGRRLAISRDRTHELRLAPGAGGDERLSLRVAGVVHDLLRLNPTQAEIDAPDIRPITHLGPTGERLTSWLLLPPTAASPTRAPLIISPYLGARYPDPPRGADWRDGGPIGEAGLLAAAGYAVLFPSLPLPAAPAAPADGIADRMLALAEQIGRDPDLARRVDVARLGLWGASYGGYSVLSAVTQSDRFRAVVAMAAPTQMFSKHGEFHPQWRVDPSQGIEGNMSMGYVEANQGAVGAPPWAAPEQFVRYSPALQADRIRTPVLLLHGDQDNILHTQAEAMFMALYRQDKDAQLVTYWGEGHAIRSPGNLRDLVPRALAFLNDRLAGWESPPASASSPVNPVAAPHPEPGPASAAPTARRPRR